MIKEYTEQIRCLLEQIRRSPTAFQATETVTNLLKADGFTCLHDGEQWELSPGAGYYITRNGSAVIAFRVPTETPDSLMIAASHTDSPTFKLKPDFESVVSNRYLRLNTEPYGGTIFSTWMDRPLSIAGRAVLSDRNGFRLRNIMIDRDLVLIPSVAIHMNRKVNEGTPLNPAVDLLPIFGTTDEKGTLKKLIAENLECREEEVVGLDLFLYNRTPGSIWGASGEFFSSPRIDNLSCVFGTVAGFLQAKPKPGTLTVYYAADNEETGSATKQGAGSVFLSDILNRICEVLGTNRAALLASGFMVSADNGHAMHPNHPELSDSNNAPVPNGGVVIKSNASQKYATDALSSAVFAEICHRAEVPVQFYSNRSDLPGGSTLGSISDTLVPVNTVDIGLAQLAMHSCYETAGCRDYDWLIRAMKCFYSLSVLQTKDGFQLV